MAEWRARGDCVHTAMRVADWLSVVYNKNKYTSVSSSNLLIILELSSLYS